MNFFEVFSDENILIFLEVFSNKSDDYTLYIKCCSIKHKNQFYKNKKLYSHEIKDKVVLNKSNDYTFYIK